MAAKNLALGWAGRAWLPVWGMGSRILTWNKSGLALFKGYCDAQIPDRVRIHLTVASAATCRLGPGHWHPSLQLVQLSVGPWVSGPL